MQNTPTQTMQQTHKTWNKSALPCIKCKKSTQRSYKFYISYPVTYFKPRYYVQWCFLRWRWVHEYAENKSSLHLSNHLLSSRCSADKSISAAVTGLCGETAKVQPSLCVYLFKRIREKNTFFLSTLTMQTLSVYFLIATTQQIRQNTKRHQHNLKAIRNYFTFCRIGGSYEFV